jgi:hypothetical protein
MLASMALTQFAVVIAQVSPRLGDVNANLAMLDRVGSDRRNRLMRCPCRPKSGYCERLTAAYPEILISSYVRICWGNEPARRTTRLSFSPYQRVSLNTVGPAVPASLSRDRERTAQRTDRR